MNLLLLEPAEITAAGTVHLQGRRAAHAVEVLRASEGDRLRVGVLHGRTGSGRVLALSPDRRCPELTLALDLDAAPPPRSPVSLLLALPRPKVLRRVLQAVAGMGLPAVMLVGSYRVEKSYFDSPFLGPEAIARELRLGLEQARDTVPPQVEVRRRFKPFVEDELDAWAGDAQRLLAHPGAARGLSAAPPVAARAALAVGPEGGFTPYEAGLLAEHGFTPFTFGARPLRVEAAVAYAVGQLELWLAR